VNNENGRKRIWFVAAVALVLVLGAAVCLGRPAYRRYKERRSFTQARAFLAKGDYRNAVLCLRQTLSLNPANVPAVRLMADLAAEAQSPVALAWRRRVAELAPTLDNKILLAATALRVEKTPFPITTQTLDEIRPAGGTNTAYHLVASQLALRLNHLADAETHLQAAARLEPTNRLHQLNLATLRLQSKNPDPAAAARQELTALTSDPALDQYALRSLVADSLMRRQWADAETFSRQLLTNSRAQFADRVQHLTVLQAAQSPELAAALAELEQRAGTNIIQIAQLLIWLNTHERAAHALTWLATLPAVTKSTPPIPLFEADACITLRDWAELESRLQAERWGDQEFLRQALLARALREQRRHDVANAVWARAVVAASARPELLVALAQLASSWGWDTETEALLWALVKRAPREQWPLQSLQRGYMAKGNTAGLYRVYQALLEHDPQSVVAKNNVAASALLLQRDLHRAASLAREVYDADKTNAIFVSTYAFALHVQGKSAEGLKLMQTLTDAELQRPEIATYYALLLSTAGERDKAKTFFDAAEKGQMLPEERKLLAEAQRQN